jgi:hypothetical protein
MAATPAGAPQRQPLPALAAGAVCRSRLLRPCSGQPLRRTARSVDPARAPHSVGLELRASRTGHRGSTEPGSPAGTGGRRAPSGCAWAPTAAKSSSSVGRSVKSSPTYRNATDQSGRTRNNAGLAMPLSAAFSTPHGSITAASGSLRIGKGSSSLSTMARFCSTVSTQMPTTYRPAR